MDSGQHTCPCELLLRSPESQAGPHVYEPTTRSLTVWAQIPVLILSSCVALGSVLPLPQFPYWEQKDNNTRKYGYGKD